MAMNRVCVSALPFVIGAGLEVKELVRSVLSLSDSDFSTVFLTGSFDSETVGSRLPKTRHCSGDSIASRYTNHQWNIPPRYSRKVPGCMVRTMVSILLMK